MKLRIKGNSIRMRLMQSEVQAFKQEGILTEEVRFPGGQFFSYTLRIGERYDARFEQDELTIFIPGDVSSPWIDSEELTLKASLNLQNDELLSLLIEKDLECLIEREGEDESDAFPNPRKNS